jgi:hypothetical protein
MGLLDDAIREHLELKRRRGADASEINRLEREALGPVRRSPHDAPDFLIDEESSQAGSYPAEEAVAGWPEDSDEAGLFDHAAPSFREAPPTEHWSEPEPLQDFEPPPSNSYEGERDADRDRRSDLPRHHEIAEEWEAHERQGLAREQAGFEPDEPVPGRPVPPPAAPPPASAAPQFEEETAEYEVEADEGFGDRASEPQEGEELLEETPDFLQDTPDHDRLWFEQRPPRDFDFDG